MNLYLASNNAHKAQEFQSLFPDVRVIIPGDAGIPFDYEETEETFLGNSLGKARALFELVRAPVLADDSGLCVDALGGAPGVRSARFGSPDDGRTTLAAGDKNALLLRAMEGKTDRSCRFICALCLMVPGERLLIAQETCEGSLLTASRGAGGFGYDPIFFLPALGLSMAELSADQKNAYSHRGRAAARIQAALAALSV